MQSVRPIGANQCHSPRFSGSFDVDKVKDNDMLGQQLVNARSTVRRCKREGEAVACVCWRRLAWRHAFVVVSTETFAFSPAQVYKTQ